MPAPLSFEQRQRIFVLWRQGLQSSVVAQRLHLAPRSVRRLCRAFDRKGEAALLPAYPHQPPATPTPAIQQALLLHEQHPTWGAPYLLIKLRYVHPEPSALPSARTLQRWFRRHDQPAACPGRIPASTADRASEPHGVWQMDAVEQCRLASGQQISWLRWVDEFSGAVLGTRVFPLVGVWPSARGRYSHIDAAAV
jgi:hypothetical protein